MRHYYDMYDYYDYGSSYADTVMMGIVMICMIALLVWAVFSLGSYILKGIGMFTIAKRIALDYAWLAFVPFARTYLHGELSGRISLKKKSIQNPGIWLLALPFLYSAVYSVLYAILWFVGFGALIKMDSYHMPYNLDFSTGNIMGIVVVFLILMVVSVGYTAFYKALEVLVNHQILERFTSKNMSIVHAVLCTIIPIYESICFFVMRNRPFNPGMEPPAPAPFMQSPPPGSYYDNSRQAGYPGSSMQGGYGGYGGTSAPSDANNYGGYSGTSAPSDANNYGSYSGTSASSDANSYGSYGNWGSSAAQADVSSFGNTSTQAQNINSYYGNSTGSIKTTENEQAEPSANAQTGSSVNFTLSGNEGAENQQSPNMAENPETDSSEDKHTGI